MKKMLLEESNDLMVAENRVSDDEIADYLLRVLGSERSFRSGSLLTAEEICTSENLAMVRHLELGDAIQVCYACLQEHGFQGDNRQFLMRRQTAAWRQGVPKEHTGGIIMVYLKLVMGYDL